MGSVREKDGCGTLKSVYARTVPGKEFRELASEIPFLDDWVLEGHIRNFK